MHFPGTMFGLGLEDLVWLVWNPVDLGSRWAIEGHDYSASLYIPFAISYHRGVHDVIYIQFKFNCKVKKRQRTHSAGGPPPPRTGTLTVGAVRLRRYACWWGMSSQR
jgi:hypothetical protein